MKAAILLVAILSWAGPVRAYEAAYPMTAAGFCEIKKLPAGTVLRTSMRGGYFDENNNLFLRLFDTINRNRVPMTVPVEAKMMPGTMVFYLDSASAKRKDLQLPAGVIRQTLPPRAVASIGIRGGYSRDSYETNLVKLRAWLKTQGQWAEAGEPYAVYWNSPFMVPFMKRSEVHLPVARKK
jgi:hypothetical protein